MLGRMVAVVGVLFASLSVQAQQCKTNLTGHWEITASVQGYSGSAYFVQSGTSFSGVSPGGVIRSAVCPGSSEDMSWLASAGFWAGKSISSDGNSITGGTVQLDSRDGRVLAMWTAKRLSNSAGPPAVASVVHAASGLRTRQVAPGQLISIYGNTFANPIGPNIPVGMAITDGKVSTSLAGVRVEFLPIGAFAPLTYVSAGQINAIVPYEVAGLSNAQIKVHFGERSSNVNSDGAPAILTITSSAPGLFTANGSGTGPAAILNQDGSVNSLERRARRGEVVTLFLTGAGQTSPPGASGKITVPSASEPITPRPLAPVDVRINGQPARVLFYGEAPGLVSGVVQLNVEVPATSSSGAVPLIVTVDDRRSREGVTVAVE